jgi:basic membrane lipoprotein Med (substrate-binding protein (PBP1-ABC) superfamily)/DNA-binding SARP family transcriptional activator
VGTSEATLFRVLGPVEVDVDGHRLGLGPPLQRTLLGVLALHHDEVLPTDRLTELLWGEHPPRTAGHSLQAYVSGLRSIIGPDRIETSTPGYLLHADDREIDAYRFESLVIQAIRAMDGGDARTAVGFLEQALGWWRGVPLADAPDSLALAGERRRLHELHLRAVDTWAGAQLELGQHARIVPELERLTSEHPYAEPLWGHLLLALHRAGRSADALRAYQRLRALVAEELGVDPSPGLTALYEGILVQDPHLLGPATPTTVAAGGVATERVPAEGVASTNPYKGLRPFTEEDQSDFFGRDELVRELLDALKDPNLELLALVGPSGSGKSSALHAGLLPALRTGGLVSPWLAGATIVTVLPGSDPVAACAAALASAAGREPPSALRGTRWLLDLLDQLPGLAPLVLVLDQFEEVFTLVPEAEEQHRIVEGLERALRERPRELRLVVALRADHFDRPLTHTGFGRRLVAGTVGVLPLTPEQLEAAASGPARRAGLTIEPALLAELLRDVTDQPGGLPLFQYALTVLTERRRDSTLTLDGYRALGGIHGAVSRRADELYERLPAAEQAVARQVFLRLVHAGDRTDQRRRVPARELSSLALDPVATQTVLDRFGRARLLSFDREPGTGAATIELAHDALLAAWGRLRSWIDEARDDLQRRAALGAAVDEWHAADEDPDFLLVGARLDRYERWAAATPLRLTTDEHRFLTTSAQRRDREEAVAGARAEAEDRLRRRAARQLWGLGGAVLVVLLLGALIASSVLGGPAARVALVQTGGEAGTFGRIMMAGLEQAGRDLGVETDHVLSQTDVAGDVHSLCASGTDLIFVAGVEIGSQDEAIAAVEDCPDSVLAVIDVEGDDRTPPNILPVFFTHEEGAFLAGAAAAMTTRTGVVGFLGGQEVGLIETFRAGFEAGVEHAAPDVEVVATFVTEPGEDLYEAFGNVALGREAAYTLFEAGADVAFTAAGDAGTGALDVAEELSTPERPLWVIGVDSDWAITEPAGRARHVLTSVVKRLDRVMVAVTEAYLDGDLDRVRDGFSVAEGALELSRRGGHLDARLPELESFEQGIVDGTIAVPRTPDGPTLPLSERSRELLDASRESTGDGGSVGGS